MPLFEVALRIGNFANRTASVDDRLDHARLRQNPRSCRSVALREASSVTRDCLLVSDRRLAASGVRIGPSRWPRGAHICCKFFISRVLVDSHRSEYALVDEIDAQPTASRRTPLQPDAEEAVIRSERITQQNLPPHAGVHRNFLRKRRTFTTGWAENAEYARIVVNVLRFREEEGDWNGNGPRWRQPEVNVDENDVVEGLCAAFGRDWHACVND